MKKIAFSFLVAALLLVSGCSKENGPVLVPVSLQVNLPGDDTPIYTRTPPGLRPESRPWALM